MLILALVTLTLALTIIAWTTAYAVQEPLVNLLWLDRARREDAWLDTIMDMHETLQSLITLGEQV